MPRNRWAPPDIAQKRVSMIMDFLTSSSKTQLQAKIAVEEKYILALKPVA